MKSVKVGDVRRNTIVDLPSKRLRQGSQIQSTMGNTCRRLRKFTGKLINLT